MIVLVPFILLPLSITMIVRRKRAGRSRLLPWSLLLFSIGALAWSVIGLILVFGDIANAEPTMKATLLARGISQVMNEIVYGLAILLLAELPIALADRLIDRRAARVPPVPMPPS